MDLCTVLAVEFGGLCSPACCVFISLWFYFYFDHIVGWKFRWLYPGTMESAGRKQKKVSLGFSVCVCVLMHSQHSVKDISRSTWLNVCCASCVCVIQGADPLGYTPVQISEGSEAYLHSRHTSSYRSWVSNNCMITHPANSPAFYCHDVAFIGTMTSVHKMQKTTFKKPCMTLTRTKLMKYFERV